MRKFVVFVLCAALSCGFVGCGGEVTADKVFEAISKEGNVVMDARYTAKSKAQDDAEYLKFRLPDEERAVPVEKDCSIELYDSEENVEIAAQSYNELAEQYDSSSVYLFASGNVLMMLDGNITTAATEKYTKALKKATGKKVEPKHTKDMSNIVAGSA